MKKFALFAAAVAMAGAAALSGCGDKQDEVITLKLGHCHAEQDQWQEGSLKFKEELEKLSNGTIKVQIYPNSTLGGDRDMVEGMKMGTVDLALVAGVFANFDDTISILELPYLFRSYDEYKKIVTGPIGKEIEANILKSCNVRILDWWDRNSRQVTSNRPVNTPADLHGLKIRVPEIPAMVDVWRAMGATPTPMAMSEVYTGLQQGTIDAQENPIATIYGARLQEVQKYIVMTNHKFEYVTLAMSEKRFSSLTDEQKGWVRQAAKAATEFENNLVATDEEKLLKEMQENNGIEVIYPDIKPFADLATPAHLPFAQRIGQEAFLERINKELGR